MNKRPDFEIESKVNKHPSKYAILIPKLSKTELLNKLKNGSNKAVINAIYDNKGRLENNGEFGLTLNDFHIYKLVYYPNYIKSEMDNYIEYTPSKSFDFLDKFTSSSLDKLLKHFKLEDKILDINKYIHSTSRDYQRYIKTVVQQSNAKYIDRGARYNNELGHFKLFKMPDNSTTEKDLSGHIIFTYGLRDILTQIELSCNKLSKYLLSTVESNYMDESEKSIYLSKHSEFYALHYLSRGNYISNEIIKLMLPFLYNLRYINSEPKQQEYTIKTLLNEYTREIEIPFKIVNKKKMSFIKSITAKTMLQDPINFFNYEIEDINKHETLAELVQDFVNIYSPSPVINNYYSHRQAIKELTLELYTVLYNNRNNFQNKELLMKQLNMRFFDKLDYLNNLMESLSIKYGFVNCNYSMGRIAYKSAISIHKPNDVTLYKDPRLSSTELASYTGGLINTYVQGKVKRPLVTLDVNSMYAYAMANYPMPTSVREDKFSEVLISLKELIDKSKDTKCCIAKVEVVIPKKIGISPVPLKVDLKSNITSIDGKTELIWDSVTEFPVGQFTTTLCYYTLEYLLELQKEYPSIRCTIKNYIIYNSAMYLEDYSRYLFKLRNDIRKYPIHSEIMNTVKQAQLTFYGKFASRKYTDEGKRTKEVKRDSFPAVASHITDIARIKLYKYMKKAKFENVYYANTDGFKVNIEGFLNLMDEINLKDKPLGMLKIESIGYFIFFGKAGYVGYKIGSNFTERLKRWHGGGPRNNTVNESLNMFYSYLKDESSDIDIPNYKSWCSNLSSNEYLNKIHKIDLINNPSIQDMMNFMYYSTKFQSIDLSETNPIYHNMNVFEKYIQEEIQICNIAVNDCTYIIEDFNKNSDYVKNLLNNNQTEEELDINI